MSYSILHLYGTTSELPRTGITNYQNWQLSELPEKEPEP